VKELTALEIYSDTLRAQGEKENKLKRIITGVLYFYYRHGWEFYPPDPYIVRTYYRMQ